ncbi:hypothetical protein [Methanoculleus chikugoensis]|uniref:hypothetical protein n=1 Tax=Methanoculleus chikugoensis TaxID=118126 RepID=UPI001FB4B5BD|nr:hypothetical protein [Methanoculleus chikugoensis]
MHGGSIITHAWNPDDYHRHSAAQRAWAHELIEKLALAGDERVLDLGCGGEGGKVTAELAACLPLRFGARPRSLPRYDRLCPGALPPGTVSESPVHGGRHARSAVR